MKTFNNLVRIIAAVAGIILVSACWATLMMLLTYIFSWDTNSELFVPLSTLGGLSIVGVAGILLIGWVLDHD